MPLETAPSQFSVLEGDCRNSNDTAMSERLSATVPSDGTVLSQKSRDGVTLNPGDKVANGEGVCRR